MDEQRKQDRRKAIESPAPGTSELKFITDPGLRANLRIDIGAITRALSNGEWKFARRVAQTSRGGAGH